MNASAIHVRRARITFLTSPTKEGFNEEDVWLLSPPWGEYNSDNESSYAFIDIFRIPLADTSYQFFVF